jgi:hypothetical protein
MRNSEVMFSLQEDIDGVIELIDDEYQYNHIDEPIQKAASEFKFDPNVLFDHEFFIRTMGNFVSHIYMHGLRVRQTMTIEQARSEALFILAHNYQGTYAQGYNVAYLDASNPDTDGFESVLAQITEIVILKERSKHVRWVLASRIISKDWHIKCLFAEILLDRWKSYLPPNILACSPAQLADNLPYLFNVFITTRRLINKMVTGYAPLHGL